MTNHSKTEELRKLSNEELILRSWALRLRETRTNIERDQRIALDAELLRRGLLVDEVKR